MKKKLPDMSKWSDKKIADFWDTHDSTDYITELEDVTGEVSIAAEPTKNASIRLTPGVLDLLKQIAKAKGLPGYSSLIRVWIYDKIRQHKKVTSS